MAPALCVGCRDPFDADAGRCPNCKPHRLAARLKYRVCIANRCGHYGTDAHGRTGCLLLAKPCEIMQRILAGLACSNDPPLF